MTDIGSSSWSETDASNNQNPPAGWPEGMNPSGVNNSARADKGGIKRFWNRINAVKTTAGSSTSYTLTYDVAASQYFDGEIHSFVVDEANGASPTLNINGIGSRPLQFYCGGAWAALPPFMLGANQVVQVRYDLSALAFRCINLPLILQQSVSGVAVIDFTDLPSNVNNIECRFEIKPATDGAIFKLRTYDASGALDTGASEYSWWTLAFTTAAASPTSTADTADSNMALTGATDNGSTGVSGTIRAENIQAATYTKFTYDTNYLESTGTNGVGIEGRGQRLEADRITGARIYTDSGVFTGKAVMRLS